MAKTSMRRNVRPERDQAGCIWGLISIFDFRHGRSTRKLLADRRRGNRNGMEVYSRTKLSMLTDLDDKIQSIEDDKESEAVVDLAKTSVKKLMEEEMLNEEGPKEQSNTEQVEQKDLDIEHGNDARNNKPTNKCRKKSCDMDISDVNGVATGLHENTCHQLSEQKSTNNIDLRMIMEEICQIYHKSNGSVKHCLHDDHDTQSNQANFSVEEKIAAAIKLYTNQWLSDGEHLTEDDRMLQAREFIDALHMTSSDKDLLLKFLLDPDSLLVKHIKGVGGSLLKKDPNYSSVAEKNSSHDEPKMKGEELVSRKHRFFLRRKKRPEEINALKGNEKSQSSSRIVILKPGPAGSRRSDNDNHVRTSLQSNSIIQNKLQSEKNVSQFSFDEIKRKLKYAMGKERQGISLMNTNHNYSHEHQNLADSERCISGKTPGWSSPNRNHLYTERYAKLPNGIKWEDKIGQPKDFGMTVNNDSTGYPKQGIPKIYIEAKKHLSEMLNNGDQDVELMFRQLPKSLGRILSLPDYNFSTCSSPRKDREEDFVTERMRSPPCCDFYMVLDNKCQIPPENNGVDCSSSAQKLENISCIIDKNLDEKRQSCPCHSDIAEQTHTNLVELPSSTKEIFVSDGIAGKSETTATIDQEESNVSHVTCEPSSSIITSDLQNRDIVEACDEERFPQSLSVDLVEEHQPLFSPLTSPSSSPLTGKIKDPDFSIDKTERPSPVSVLEPLFTEDDISAASTISQSVGVTVQPLKIQFDERVCSAPDGLSVRNRMEDEESAFEYVEAVLLGSGLNWNEFLLRWLSLNQLLDPSLFEEVELFPNQSCHDQKLLFDCTNEVLKEVCERYFGCSPRLSFVKQNIRPVPKGMELILEVWEGVEWHLLQHPTPRSLDQHVRKDLDKSEMWMNLRFDTEQLGFQMGEAVLEELIADTILSFVDDGPEIEVSVLTEQRLHSSATTNYKLSTCHSIIYAS